MAARRTKLIVITSADSPELCVLDSLKDSVETVAIGQSPSDFEHLSPEAWQSIDVLLNCGTALFPPSQSLKWLRDFVCNLQIYTRSL